MEILRAALAQRRIEAYEAGGAFAPAQQVFCQKICSKVIQSQFCIVLLNNESVGAVQTTNANVYMEYGLMLGFNKYVIPFQHEDYQLPFNVSGLDTVKYNNSTFKAKSDAALDQAISLTTKSATSPEVSPDIGAYLLLRGGIVSAIDTPGDKAFYQLGAICGFNLCIDFTGNRYMYFGNFAHLTPSVIEWRVKKLIEIMDARIGGAAFRVKSGWFTQPQLDVLTQLRQTVEIWILVKDAVDRDALLPLVVGCTVSPAVFTVADVSNEVGKSKMY